MIKYWLACTSLFILFIGLFAQTAPVAPGLIEKKWDAQWVTNVTGKYNPSFAGVLLFRETFTLDELPDEFIIHASADNRYQLFVNGKRVGNGPARSEIEHWVFESYDIADKLIPGKNILAAKVWNYGKLKPWARQSVKTGFILQGNSEKEAPVNTGHSWKVYQNPAYGFETHETVFFPHATGVGPCERFDASEHPWGWKSLGFDDSSWLAASSIGQGRPVKANPKKYLWSLEPRTFPALSYSAERLKKVVRAKGIEVDDSFLKGNKELTVPANSRVEILLDREEITTAYPRLRVSGGADSKIQCIYNEALYNDQNEKVERYKTKGLKLIGYYDHFHPDGGRNRIYEPLWFRTYRFMQLNIETSNEPLVIHDLTAFKSTYPFELKASFTSSDPLLEKIFETGWRTALLSAHETYEDCPYYEQLQYFGDLNMSNPITVLLSGDTRLMKNAILQGEHSRKSGHLTTCAYPTTESGKIIPFFSIAWIGMLDNYWQYQGDTAFVKQFLPSVKAILAWYQDKLNDQKMLGPMPYWNFIDCTPAWPWAPEKGSICEPTGTYTGNSSILSLQFVYGLQLAEKLFSQLGENKKAMEYKVLANQVKKACYQLCWDKEKHYLADTPSKYNFSQHANVFAALTGVFPEGKNQEVLHRLYKDSTLTQMSLQFQAYFHKALVKYGLANEYLDYLDTWKQLIDWGFTTFPEYPELNARSDCHPWNAYPAYELLTIVCGIQPASPGFASVNIQPHLGKLEWVKGSLPHPKGDIMVKLEQARGGLKGEIMVPDGLPATFTWGGKSVELRTGVNKINVKGLLKK